MASQQISETADRFKSEFQYVDNNGRNQTYLADIDTWFYFRRVRNLAEKGHVWDVERDGVKLDDHMNAHGHEAVGETLSKLVQAQP